MCIGQGTIGLIGIFLVPPPQKKNMKAWHKMSRTEQITTPGFIVAVIIFETILALGFFFCPMSPVPCVVLTLVPSFYAHQSCHRRGKTW